MALFSKKSKTDSETDSHPAQAVNPGPASTSANPPPPVNNEPDPAGMAVLTLFALGNLTSSANTAKQ